jgi:nucleoside-diphosphate-sugar epimerase
VRVAVIGATGHVGTYLVPRLVALGHEVAAISRRKREPYLPHQAWSKVAPITLDSEEPGMAAKVADLKPDAVIDMICFTESRARALVEALRGVKHFLSCGTIWVHGHSTVVPATEDLPRRPFGDYGLQKAAIEAYLLEEHFRSGFPATILHPGHIVGTGHIPVNPAGNKNPEVFSRLACADDVALPNLGLETLHHVHASDVAEAFVLALQKPESSIGESFHVVSPAAITLRGFAEAVAGWFDRPARLRFLPFEEWKRGELPEDADLTWDHIAHSPNASIDKARRFLDFVPRYSSLAAVRESVNWLVTHGKIRT